MAVLLMALAGIGGALVGTYLTAYVTESLLRKGFGFLLIIGGILSLRGRGEMPRKVEKSRGRAMRGTGKICLLFCDKNKGGTVFSLIFKQGGCRYGAAFFLLLRIGSTKKGEERRGRADFDKSFGSYLVQSW